MVECLAHVSTDDVEVACISRQSTRATLHVLPGALQLADARVLRVRDRQGPDEVPRLGVPELLRLNELKLATLELEVTIYRKRPLLVAVEVLVATQYDSSVSLSVGRDRVIIVNLGVVDSHAQHAKHVSVDDR